MNKPIVDVKPAPEQPATPDPLLAELEHILRDLIARNEAQTLQWEGSNVQFNATRLYLAGQRETLKAVAGFLQGDRDGIKKLLEA